MEIITGVERRRRWRVEEKLRYRPWQEIMAVRGFRSRRRKGGGDVLVDRHREAE
jgi:hypothetical protein